MPDPFISRTVDSMTTKAFEARCRRSAKTLTNARLARDQMVRGAIEEGYSYRRISELFGISLGQVTKLNADR